MPRNTTPLPRKRCHCFSSSAASVLHGPHQDAQKLITTGLPRTDASENDPPSRLFATKFGAGPPIVGGFGRCVSLQTSRPSRPATAASATAWPVSLATRIEAMLSSDDVHGRADLDVVEQPFRLRNVHADAAV